MEADLSGRKSPRGRARFGFLLAVDSPDCYVAAAAFIETDWVMINGSD
jgi:hypothetical protein